MKSSKTKQVEVAYVRGELRMLMLRSFKQIALIDKRLDGNTDKNEISKLKSYKDDLNNYINGLHSRLTNLNYEV